MIDFLPIAKIESQYEAVHSLRGPRAGPRWMPRVTLRVDGVAAWVLDGLPWAGSENAFVIAIIYLREQTIAELSSKGDEFHVFRD